MSELKKIKATRFRGLAEKEVILSVEGFCAELLRFLPLQRLPPKVILEIYTMKGEINYGMSGGIRWTPFKLDRREYREVAGKLSGGEPSTSQEFESEIDWEAFCYKERYGMPEDQYKHLVGNLIDREREWNEAKRSKSAEEIERLQMEFLQASSAFFAFFDKYVEGHE